MEKFTFAQIRTPLPWGHHKEHWMPPMMPYMMGVLMDVPCDGGSDGHPCDHKTTLNIDIYPSTLVFVENIGPKYDFYGGQGGFWYGKLRGGGWSRSKEKKVFNRILIHIYLQSMFILSFQSTVLGFGTKYT